ncbi:hypothetical protein [Streptomyces spongiae]|uniref:Uncharacterized protein n=1 Tax=Streptomyces spongiae TaxID=565072 RepID=A0A5N8XFW0_9ACTN|nr:hypothetical protein [Streptomyces spongiae]MPY57435.1 hypothetical protein [Streptomyces spongiae]
MQNVSSQIQNALHQASPEAAIRDVKQVMARELQALDPKTEIKSTDYFNHTFVPDFVLNWGAGSERPTRDVYLRFNIDAPLIQRDLLSLHEESPAFISIATTGSPGGQTETIAAEYDNCLLSSAATLEGISSEDSRTPVSQMLKSSLLQGGKGYLVGESAIDVQRAVSHADSALTTLDAPEVSATVRAMNDHFSRGFSARIERVMQVLWVSQGGDATDFPGTLESRSVLSPDELIEILPFLLSLEDISNIEFWRNLGENISLRLLQDLENWPTSANLNLLVNANLDRIKTKGVALDQVDLNLFDDPDAPPYWDIQESQLHLRCSEIDLRFVDDRRKTAHRSDIGRTPQWSEIESRLDQYGIEGIEFASPGSKTRIKSNTMDGLRESTDMRALSDALGNLARVISVELRLPDSRDNVEIDFDRSAVDAVGAALSPHLLAHLGLDLLYQASQKTLEDLRAFMTVSHSLPWWKDKKMKRMWGYSD